ncbi:methylmalonyl Co-A mutase-associated GTPase MeaB [Putridiphycobacter roseus]|uniref:Methylmalonyl Co-A mutase-associated GTPase MeaB n=1 Tax=Putridiphycobacter roseus TaxID=2219161 RepID=A0A2W1N0K5_9FLAO|nr:methylmalonyl Co-A mutase-associated GTPase MeaB [Putridiphycobacter roseus]PZE17274.1 methylmalonyl Co-A mutase-associated GTPase MeaB [Putridiphycobacter roseus]
MSKSTNPNTKQIENLIAIKKNRQSTQSIKILSKSIIEGNIQALSESITLLESTKNSDQKLAQGIIQTCLPHAGNSIRIGITGVPGVGKSTFIEQFGLSLIEKGHQVAVLAIDPSSEKTKGSILGDKTRMNELAVHPKAFIRPSANAGSLGGVARKTRESIILCEASGFDIILVETVGVGQSEIAVHSMTDFFLLLMLAGAGDELQGIKRGIMEMADSILITKADGENVKHANLARLEYKNALHLFPLTANLWTPKVETISALEKHGIEKAIKIINDFKAHTKKNGHFAEKRSQQQKYWMSETLKEMILKNAYAKPNFNTLKTDMEAKILKGEISSFHAAEQIYKNLYPNE